MDIISIVLLVLLVVLVVAFIFYAQNIKKNKQDAESLFNEAENKANEVMANAKREAESLKMELKPSKKKPVTPFVKKNKSSVVKSKMNLSKNVRS